MLGLIRAWFLWPKTEDIQMTWDTCAQCITWTALPTDQPMRRRLRGTLSDSFQNGTVKTGRHGPSRACDHAHRGPRSIICVRGVVGEVLSFWVSCFYASSPRSEL